MIRELLKNVSEKVNLIIKTYHFFIQILFKLNIQLVYLVTTNKFLYFIYIFVIMFFLYSKKDPSYFHLVSAIFFAYPLMTSLQLYLLCKIKIKRVWLESFLGKDFLVNNLGDSYGARSFIILLIGLLSVVSIETISLLLLDLQNEVLIDNLIDTYEVSFGIKEDWSTEQKLECLRAVGHLIALRKQGLITSVMSFLY